MVGNRPRKGLLQWWTEVATLEEDLVLKGGNVICVIFYQQQ